MCSPRIINYVEPLHRAVERDHFNQFSKLISKLIFKTIFSIKFGSTAFLSVNFIFRTSERILSSTIRASNL